jgi:MoxR-like ATPase
LGEYVLEDVSELHKHVSRVIDEVSKVVIGKSDTLRLLLAGLLGEGHILIEGFPGTAKTLLARAFAKAIGGVFKRIQFTSDTLPSDIVGFYLYTLAGRGELVKGPVFTNILLADELNRGPARTQSALLEAMQDRTVTIEGVTMELPRPFMVLATQIPYGSPGTNPLTEVQIDRFMFRVWSGYNPRDVERMVMEKIDYIDMMPIETVLDGDVIGKCIDSVKRVGVTEDIKNYILDIVDTVRRREEVLVGPSTRGVLALYKGARALAFLEGRDYVIPDDVKFLAHPSLDHRVRIRAEAVVEGVKPEDVVERAIKEVPVPK